MNYCKQIDKVITFIGQNIDEEMTLEQLSAVACFSKYHFHRLFTAYTGLSLNQYIRWLRLKRAASQLRIDHDKSILTIAVAAGFDSHEAFTRAFKQACGFTPSQYRAHHNSKMWDQPAYQLPKSRDEVMKVTIKNIKQRHLACLEHHGDPKLMDQTVTTLVNWIKTEPRLQKPEPGESFGLAYSDPKTTPTEDFQFDLGVTTPTDLKLNAPLVEKVLPEGRYAIATHYGSHEEIGETVSALYREWLPNSEESLGDFPCVFRYYNFKHEVAETELVTDVMLLLKA